MLVSVATEYNNALLVVENANIGWDVVNTIIEKGYPKMYYSPRAYGDLNWEFPSLNPNIKKFFAF